MKQGADKFLAVITFEIIVFAVVFGFLIIVAPYIGKIHLISKEALKSEIIYDNTK